MILPFDHLERNREKDENKSCLHTEHWTHISRYYSVHDNGKWEWMFCALVFFHLWCVAPFSVGRKAKQMDTNISNLKRIKYWIKYWIDDILTIKYFRKWKKKNEIRWKGYVLCICILGCAFFRMDILQFLFRGKTVIWATVYGDKHTSLIPFQIRNSSRFEFESFSCPQIAMIIISFGLGLQDINRTFSVQACSRQGDFFSI